MTTSTDRPSAAPMLPSDQIPNNTSTPLTYNFAFSDFLKKEYRFGLDPTRPICKAFREGFCPLGAACPDKHGTAHSNNLVCKHWLKGLCKKGDQCDYLHEYNIRARPDCTNFNRTGYCVAGEDCNYTHVDPATRLPPCPHYEKGMCPLGLRCSKKHVRKTLCPFYLAGFCPYGRQCKEGAHPRFPEDLPKPTVKVEKSAEEVELERERLREEADRQEQREYDRNESFRKEGRGRGKGRYGQRRRGGYER
ncbi:RNA-binding component of cleavage and polyadenylation factor [Mycoblastus sanguinarius]|nr:RNA-binding component of cleavage and polyadenylation factor [Mycoblastus sanguinarius]